MDFYDRFYREPLLAGVDEIGKRFNRMACVSWESDDH